MGDVICGRTRTEPCTPLHDVAKHCNSARLWADIADTWQTPGLNGRGIKVWPQNLVFTVHSIGSPCTLVVAQSFTAC